MEVYQLCRNQVILVPMGGPIGLRMESVKAGMELLGIDEEDRLDCLEKVMVLTEKLYKKDE